MIDRIYNDFVCPIHKSRLEIANRTATAGGVIKYGDFICRDCGGSVGSARRGQFDFLRVAPVSVVAEDQVCADFVSRRIPWTDGRVTHQNMTLVNEGWSAEAVGGCLVSDSDPNWRIELSSDATDLAVRVAVHEASGAIIVECDGQQIARIDLAQLPVGEARSAEVFRNLTGSRTILLKGDPAAPHARFSFYGFDGCFDGQPSAVGGNRGNGFPQTYQWALSYLDQDSLVLDCGSGDRKFPDPRVLAFEYMPFEYPDVFGDGHALPFADETFDVVFSQAVMEHMRDPYLAAREIMRVTKPGGLIYGESAFMQPLHAVPYHFFNTTPWGFEALFVGLGVDHHITEWFGPLSTSLAWYIDSCGGGGLSLEERAQVMTLLQKVDANTSYEQLKPVASAVAFWGVKQGPSRWRGLLANADRPTFKYG